MNYKAAFENFLNDCADEASEIALRYFRKDLQLTIKTDESPVTQADLLIEQGFREKVARYFPEHGVTGEEYAGAQHGAEFVWVIDPIDGTKSFAVGRPLFGTVIGLMHNKMPVAGLIDQAFTKERWLGFKNEGAFFNTQAIKAAPETSLEMARSFFSPPAIFSQDIRARVMQLSDKVKWPHFGCDCYAYGLLAMGCIDLVVEQHLKWHDISGIIALIVEAGGHVQDWSGEPLHEDWDGTLIAATGPKLAAEVARFLKN